MTSPELNLGTDLKAARRSFEVGSTAVADLAGPQRADLNVKFYQCPMAPVGKEARLDSTKD